MIRSVAVGACGSRERLGMAAEWLVPVVAVGGQALVGVAATDA